MKVYLVGQFNITNPAEFRFYADHSQKTVEAFGGKYLARGESTVIEGKPVGNRNVIIEFPSRQAAESWYNSPEYQNIIHHRKNNTSNASFVVMLDEYNPPS